jgi:toluene monooxygenase system ferredoxin subunit
VVRLADEVHAYLDRCAHLGVALSEGTLEGGVLTCSAHHWQYDAATGRGINPDTACLVRFPVTITDGDVYVEVER